MQKASGQKKNLRAESEPLNKELSPENPPFRASHWLWVKQKINILKFSSSAPLQNPNVSEEMAEFQLWVQISGRVKEACDEYVTD